MTESATITFSQVGVQPPVYVVTSLSDPPWATLEMAVDKDDAETDNLVFSRHFDNVAAGDYQYKIRQGDGHWVVDESKDSTTDQQGNRNNVLHVKPNKATEPQKSIVRSSEIPQTHTDPSVTSKDSRKISTPDASDASDLPNLPVPTVVVDKIANEKQSGKGDSGPLKSRDASPLASPGGHREPGTHKEQAASLFHHESSQDDGELSVAALATMEDAPASNRTSSEIANNASSGYDESHGAEELGSAPLFPHELSDDDEDFDELNNGPLLSHETGMNGGIESSEDYMDELDAAPLLPHETGFSQYRDSDATTNSGFTDDNISEPRHYMYEDDDEDNYRAGSLQPDEAPTFTHEGSPNGESHEDGYSQDETPLLPHERDFATGYISSPEEDGQPTFDYERNSSTEPFGRSGRALLFRNRANSSTLPDKLPRTDAEDENLADPSLERFPTRREQILERVASIGLQLPEDQTMEDHVHSPVGSVLSQACSSVDLVPVKSYTSLASVPEADNSDEEDEDADGLSSPTIMNFGSTSTAFAKDPHETPMPNDSKRIALGSDSTREPHVARTTQSSETASIAKIDGVKESVISELQNATAAATNVRSPITPPLTPETKPNPTMRNDSQPAFDSELRQRHVQRGDAPKDSSIAPSEPTSHEDDMPNRTVSSSHPQHLDTHNETFLQTFFRVVFGSVGRFLTACVGDRKRAGIAMLVISVVTIVYYLA